MARVWKVAGIILLIASCATAKDDWSQAAFPSTTVDIADELTASGTTDPIVTDALTTEAPTSEMAPVIPPSEKPTIKPSVKAFIDEMLTPAFWADVVYDDSEEITDEEADLMLELLFTGEKITLDDLIVMATSYLEEMFVQEYNIRGRTQRDTINEGFTVVLQNGLERLSISLPVVREALIIFLRDESQNKSVVRRDVDRTGFSLENVCPKTAYDLMSCFMYDSIDSIRKQAISAIDFNSFLQAMDPDDIETILGLLLTETDSKY